MAYKALVGKYHPDRNPNCEKSLRAMQAINASYEVLSDPNRRSMHDKWIAEQLELHRHSTQRSESTEADAPRPKQNPERQASPPTRPPPTPEPEPLKKDPPNSGGCGCLALLAIGAVALIVILPSLNTSSSSSSSKPPSTPEIYPKGENTPQPTPFNEPTVPLPDNGELVVKANYSLAAPFQIKSQTGENFLVKLVDANNGQDVMTVFVRGGETVDTRAPLGSFHVKYASGDTWYGYDHLFGPETTYTKADETFVFSRTISEQAHRRLIDAQRRLAIADADFRSFLSDKGMPAKQAADLFDGVDSNTGKRGLERVTPEYWKSFLSKVKGVSLHNAIIDRLNARNQISNEIVRIRNTEESIEGFTITLYKVRDGNLRTSTIDAADF